MGPVAKKNGPPIPQVHSIDLKITYGSCKAHFENLFGDKAISETLNGAINNNIDSFAGAIMSLIEEKFAFFYPSEDQYHFTYDQLFPASKP